MNDETKKAVDLKAALSIRMIEVQKELASLNSTVRGKRLPSTQYRDVLARQSRARDEIMNLQTRIIELKSVVSKGYQKETTANPDGSYRDRLHERLERIESAVESISDRLDVWFGGMNDPAPPPEEIEALQRE